MLDWLTGHRGDRRKAEKLYGEVVTLARTSGFYSDFGVPDTPVGRFEMVALALFLVLERVKAQPGSNDLVRATIEAFVTDMDDCMREMGVGDTVVPKRVKRAAAGFYERSGNYRAALATPSDAAMAEALVSHVFADKPEQTANAQALARLAAALKQQLEDAPIESILSGEALRACAGRVSAAANDRKGQG